MKRQVALYMIGPGTTTRPILERMGLQKTLLGVDVLRNGVLVAEDANEDKLLSLIDKNVAKIVVTPVGGQGFIFGRGNQQFSSQVIRKVGKENILVVATPSKLISLRGAPLLVDTWDNELNGTLSGYIRIITGYRQEMVYRVC